MGQCIKVKKNGEQCRAQAVEGAEYCVHHLPQVEEGVAQAATPSVVQSGAEATPPVAPSAEKEAKVSPAVINKTTMRKIRFTGKGRYAIPSEHVVFDHEGQEEEVSYKCFDRLMSKPDTRAVFEEA